MTTTQSTKRQQYDGFGITELRTMARAAKINGRSTMDGWTLLGNMRKHWRSQRLAAEQAVIEAAKPGAILRHKSSGDLVRVTSEVTASAIKGHDGALRFNAEYLWIGEHDCFGAWEGRGTDRARYYNEQQARRVANGSDPDWHMLWQYEALAA